MRSSRQASPPSARGKDLDRKIELAREMSVDGVELLLEAVFNACHDWIVEGSEPRLDQDRVRRAVRPLMAGLLVAFRAEISRRGLTAAELDARLGWPEGNTQRMLAEPSELGFVESLLLCEELGTTMLKLLPAPQAADS